jgi:hypothetical protein
MIISEGLSFASIFVRSGKPILIAAAAEEDTSLHAAVRTKPQSWA